MFNKIYESHSNGDITTNIDKNDVNLNEKMDALTNNKKEFNSKNKNLSWTDVLKSKIVIKKEI